eukprot:Plantae.Rhodophyta-Palmaria_palmata.ctg1843.p1 GENE.Plantae.Rhodophyta-Palmaria_palmata.ctg1843~~Plantae.Rhodophyta-Palmaria_palmata.ctg1843.p1  ORF type:complete len:248 (+),score=32.59 Plantae.Rhodophyta-Palmaria_palmata.ctg1843:86-829(+)
MASEDTSEGGSGSRCDTTLLFANSRVKVFDFRLKPNSLPVVIRHTLPTIRWQVAFDAAVEHAVEVFLDHGGDAEAETLRGCVPDRRVFYVEAGTMWKVSNTSPSTTATYRQIVFELQSAVPKFSETKVGDLFAAAQFSTDVGTALLFENHLVRCWDFFLEPGEGGGPDTVHHHCLDYVFVNVAPSRLLGLHPETLSMEKLLFDSLSDDAAVTWIDIPEDASNHIRFAHGGKNGFEDRPMREYLVELK